MNAWINGSDALVHGFDVSGGETVIPGPTIGDISTGKNLTEKIAGGSDAIAQALGAGSGETSLLLDENGAQHILNGRTVKIKTVIKSYEKKFTLAKFKNEVIAIGYLKDDSFYPKKLLSYL